MNISENVSVPPTSHRRVILCPPVVDDRRTATASCALIVSCTIMGARRNRTSRVLWLRLRRDSVVAVSHECWHFRSECWLTELTQLPSLNVLVVLRSICQSL